VITASVKSSFTVPPTARISIRCGTIHRPRRVAFPPLVVEPDDVFSPRRDPADMAGDLGQVSRQRCQFAARAGRQGRAQALVKLGLGQPPVASRNTEDLDHSVPVFMGSPKLRLSVRTGTSRRREIIARHGYILQDITGDPQPRRPTTPPHH
jgi:hypothetical protein